MPTTEVLRTIINKVCIPIHSRDHGKEYVTALHFAAERNNAPAARVLLEHGATIDTPSSRGHTALMMSSSPEMITLLVNHGASLVDHFTPQGVDCLRWDDRTFANLVSVYSKMDTRQGESGTVPSFLPAIFGTRGGIPCGDLVMSPARLASFMTAHFDLNWELGLGMTLIHLAMASHASSSLILNSDLRLEETMPFPWHLMFRIYPSFLTSKYKHFRRKLKEEDFARIAHLQPVRGISPLCAAVAQ